MMTYFDYETLRDTVTAQAIKSISLSRSGIPPAPTPDTGKNGA